MRLDRARGLVPALALAWAAASGTAQAGDTKYDFTHSPFYSQTLVLGKSTHHALGPWDLPNHWNGRNVWPDPSSTYGMNFPRHLHTKIHGILGAPHALAGHLHGGAGLFSHACACGNGACGGCGNSGCGTCTSIAGGHHGGGAPYVGDPAAYGATGYVDAGHGGHGHGGHPGHGAAVGAGAGYVDPAAAGAYGAGAYGGAGVYDGGAAGYGGHACACGNGACGGCGNSGCGTCLAGLKGAGHGLLGKLHPFAGHGDKVKWFVGPGGPVPLTPGYVDYINPVRAPRDFFAFPPMTPDAPY